jgi:predicted nucleic acid binding AN1-type Zn finger protein
VPESAETPTATNITSGSLGNAGDDQPAQKNLNRCFACNKRVGLTGFKCRCGYVFCGSHRYAEAHSCKFDYKALGREHLAKSNPLVMADKINKF